MQKSPNPDAPLIWLNYSILIVDEREEFCAVDGENIDKISICDKKYAFSVGVRVMSPDVIITDELCSDSDWLGVKDVSLSGVKIMASVHAYSIDDLTKKNFFVDGVFDRYVVVRLDNKNSVRYKVFDGAFNCL